MTTTRTTPVLAGLSVTLLWAITACGGDSAAEPPSTLPDWREHSSYTYTLTSSEGERSLIGTFRVTVRDGEVTEAVGLDGESRRVVRQGPGQVPTIGDLLAEAAAARDEGADAVDVDHAGDGRPTRISVDWEENAVDDEAVYAISDYRPGAGAPLDRGL